MKRTSILLITMVFSLLSTCVPIYADPPITDQSEQQAEQKNECLLLLKNCGHAVISIQDKIEMLKEEIAKGRAVYTVEELNNLRQKLQEANKILDFLLE